MAFDSAILQSQILPALAEGQPLTESWVRQFLNKLKSNNDNVIEATRTALTTLEEDYQTADAYLSASITVELGVLTDAVSAQASRIATLESQVQTAGTGLLARVTTAEATIVTQGTAIGSLTTTVSSHTTSISSINGSLTTLSASVSTQSIALTALDGRVSAYYGIKVAAGTNIATIEAIASGGGVPSTVVITAGQIQLNGNVLVNGTVLTGAIAPNGITTAQDFEADVAILVGYVSGGSYIWNDMAACTVTTIDSTTRVLVSWAAYLSAGSDGSVCEARIVRNGSVVWGPCVVAGNAPSFAYTFDTEGYIEYTPLYNGMVSAFDTDVPGAAGTYTYTLQMAANSATSGASWDASFRRMVATVFKR